MLQVQDGYLFCIAGEATSHCHSGTILPPVSSLRMVLCSRPVEEGAMRCRCVENFNVPLPPGTITTHFYHITYSSRAELTFHPMQGFSESIRRVAKSAKKKIRSLSDSSSPKSVASSLNDPELPSTSSSDTIRAQDESYYGHGVEAMPGGAEPFPPFNESADINVPRGARTTSESAETPPQRTPSNPEISSSDGQQDEGLLSNENAMPTSENRTDEQPFESGTSDQYTEHIEDISNDTSSKPAGDVQEIKKTVTPTPPVSSFADIPHERGPLTTLPPPLPPSSWKITPPNSRDADSPTASTSRTPADAPPLPSFRLTPPSPPSASPNREDPLHRKPTNPTRKSGSEDEERGRRKHSDPSSTPISYNGASTSTASTSTSADTPASSSSDKSPAPPKTVGFAAPSSYRNHTHQYNQSSPPKSVGKDLADEMLPSTSSSKGKTSGILKQTAEQKQADVEENQADGNQSKQTQTVEWPTKVYIVIKETATTRDASPWDQVLHHIQGVYLSEMDANNKVIQMYNDRITNIGVDITLKKKGWGSQFYGWETNRMVNGAWLYRVHVQERAVQAARNEPELKPRVRSLLNV